MSTNDFKTLPFPSLFIKGFRGFRELIVPELKRVTLFVGKNSVGKTSVIEAIQLYAEQGQFNLLSNTLRKRGEIISTKDEDAYTVDVSNVNALFYGRESNETSEVIIGTNDNLPKLTIKRSSLSPNEASNWEDIFPNDVSIDENQAVEISFGTNGYKIPWKFMGNRRARRYSRIQERSAINLTSLIQYQSLEPHISNTDDLVDLWDDIALTEYEELITSAFSKVLGIQIERFAAVGNGERHRFGKRRILVKIRNEPTPIPLKSLGDGATKLFNVVLSMLNSKNGLFLIDEVENGMHYSIQEKFWELILHLANEFNVQVIATTHSFDCIQAISVVMEFSDYSNVSLIRLDDDEDQIHFTEFDHKDIVTAGKSRIEIR